MDPDFVEFYENTCFHLKNTFQSLNTWEVEASQKTLKSLAGQYEKFIEILLIIITNDKIEGLFFFPRFFDHCFREFKSRCLNTFHQHYQRESQEPVCSEIGKQIILCESDISDFP